MRTAEFLTQALLYGCIVSNLLAVYVWILDGRTKRNMHLPSMAPAAVSLLVFLGYLLVPAGTRPLGALAGYTGLYVVANVLSWQVVVQKRRQSRARLETRGGVPPATF